MPQASTWRRASSGSMSGSGSSRSSRVRGAVSTMARAVRVILRANVSRVRESSRNGLAVGGWGADKRMSNGRGVFAALVLRVPQDEREGAYDGGREDSRHRAMGCRIRLRYVGGEAFLWEARLCA